MSIIAKLENYKSTDMHLRRLLSEAAWEILNLRMALQDAKSGVDVDEEEYDLTDGPYGEGDSQMSLFDWAVDGPSVLPAEAVEVATMEVLEMRERITAFVRYIQHLIDATDNIVNHFDVGNDDGWDFEAIEQAISAYEEIKVQIPKE